MKDNHDACEKERREYLDKILKSDSSKKVVVAGAGTGKTHLFKQIIKGKKKCLTLSFVNSLVGDLSLDLRGTSDVRTLHSYARSILSTATGRDIELFPKLPHIMRQDARILLGADIDFERVFHIRDDSNQSLEFYRDRRRYYDFYGYTDIIFSAVGYLENHKEKISTYDQVVVDEFQDFNPLEVSLIELLSQKSPILIVGDDDQALYDFKSASVEHIRKSYSSGEYEAFTLPFCSRCTRVIVDATNDFLDAAKQYGLLKGRVDKAYKYFACPTKDEESTQHDKIIYRQQYAKQIPWAISMEIDAMAKEVRNSFSVLVITPTSTQCRDLASALRGKGFKNVVYDPRDRSEPTVADGLKLLAADRKGNLGWRIIIECLWDEANISKTLKEADTKKTLVDCVDKELKDVVLGHLKRLKQLDAGTINDDDLQALAKFLNIDQRELAIAEVSRLTEVVGESVDGGIGKLPIKITTVQSSKGLAADLVFIVHLDDQYFIGDKDKKNISDRDVCNFLVALTRARRKVVLISSAKQDPTFLGWIDADRVKRSA